jgi:hypothetical protein
MVTGGLPVLERNLAKQRMLTEDGPTTTRAQAIGAFRSGASTVESATLRDLRVRVAGDAAVPTTVFETNGTLKGKSLPPRSCSTDCFVKRDGR